MTKAEIVEKMGAWAKELDEAGLQTEAAVIRLTASCSVLDVVDEMVMPLLPLALSINEVISEAEREGTL